MGEPFDHPAFEARCSPCGMYKTSQAVCMSGEGTTDRGIVLLGEGLGAEEEIRLRPFVGRAGWMLEKCLAEAGLVRSEVFITNAARCRPVTKIGKNRTPTNHELRQCRGWLDDEMRLVKPRVIVALGASAIWSALAPENSGEVTELPYGGVTENQGKVLWSARYGCWVVCSFHPAYLLRRPAEEFYLVADLITAQRIAATGVPPERKIPLIKYVRTLDDAYEMRETMLRAKRFAFDWETNGVHLTKSRGFCVSFCCEAGVAYVVPLYGQEFTPRWDRRDLGILKSEFLVPVLTSDVGKIGANIPFDISISMSTLDIEGVPNVEGDTQVADHLINNHLGERAHGLKVLSVRYSPYGRYDDPLDKWLVENGYVREGKPDAGYICMAPDELVQPYCGTDSCVPYEVLPILEDKIREAGLWDVYTEERMPFILGYGRRDRVGVRIDQTRLPELGKEMVRAIEATSSQLELLAGRKINTYAHKQVSDYLYEERGLPVLGLTEGGAPSTKEEHLIQIAHLDDAVPLILHNRAYRKLEGTFLEGTEKKPGGLKLAMDSDGRARTNTLTCTVETFRLATRKPFAIHTLPRPTVMWTCNFPGHGRYQFVRCCEFAVRETLSIRSLLIPDEHYKFIERDYVQQEYALAAIASGQRDLEEAMLDRGEDAHEFVMKVIGNRSKEEFGGWTIEKGVRAFLFRSRSDEDEYKNLRADWKRINFMILYRGGEKKLARSLTVRDPQHPDDPLRNRTVDSSEAALIILQYYDRLPEIKRWQYDIIKKLRETGRVIGLFKTYRKLPGVYSPSFYDQSEAERAACNYPFQEGGARLLARVCNAIERRWEKKRDGRAAFPGRIAFTLHDEITAQVHEDHVEEGSFQMQEEMERPQDELIGGCGIRRGVRTDVKVTDAWGGLPEIEKTKPYEPPGIPPDIHTPIIIRTAVHDDDVWHSVVRTAVRE